MELFYPNRDRLMEFAGYMVALFNHGFTKLRMNNI